MNVLIYGTRKLGKSTLALAIAVTENERVVIFDPRGTFPIIQTYQISELSQRLQEHKSGTIQFSRVGPFDTDEVEEAFAEFTRVLIHEENISVIVDESHMLQGSNSLDANLDRWNRQSQSSVAVIQTTHRIVDAHPDSRYHADSVFFFYSYLPRELKTVSEGFGGDVAAQLPRLKQHQVLQWYRAPGGVPVWIVWSDPNEWYIDLENGNG